MSTFAQLSVSERAAFVGEAAARLDVLPVIVEKDFWVCWMLRQIFRSRQVGTHLVFKGGTSLSKVFGAIRRFSEDIYLSVAPPLLGWDESQLEDAPSPNQRRKRLERLESACAAKVRGDFRGELEKGVKTVLGERPDGGPWLNYPIDAASKSPVLQFDYPSALPPGGGLHPAIRESRVRLPHRPASRGNSHHRTDARRDDSGGL